MSLQNKDWGCPKKTKARSETIIDIYRDYYGRQSIPDDSQYWTMCGRCSHEDGHLGAGVEPDQIIKSNLARADQIHGVELDSQIYKGNSSIDCGIHWYEGDFLTTMRKYRESNEFKPSIVNADLVVMHQKASSYIAEIMRLLSTVPGDILLISNIILQYRSHESTMCDMIESLSEHRACRFAMDNANWVQGSHHYEYNGTGQTPTKMGTAVFIKSDK